LVFGIFFLLLFLKIFLHSMAQNIKNQCIKIAWLNLYGMIFHEQQACVYDFPSQSLAMCASAGVSELFLSTRGFATLT
jgi:hypothetical protein